MLEKDAMYRTILMHPDDDTPRRIFADFLEDNGAELRAEFIRVQIGLERFRTFDPSHRKEFNEQAREMLSKRMTRLERGESDSIKIARATEKGGQLYSQRKVHLRTRERELFTAHSREWFGENVGLDRPTPLQLSIAALAGCGWLVPARGFPAHWYGSWEQWLGVVCIRCDGDGRAHGADRPFEWSADVEYGKCVVCKGSGRITGACETLAWRPTWEMECGTCGGVKLKFTGPNGLPKCPKCGNSSQNATPHGSPELRRCASCKTVWNPDVCPTCTGSGRVPRPCPQGAVPLTDVTLTTMPDMEWMIAASVRHSRVISNDHKAQCEAEWPGLTFHLPAN